MKYSFKRNFSSPKARFEVRVLDGFPEHDDFYNDEVSRNSFDRHFAPRWQDVTGMREPVIRPGFSRP